MPWASSYDASTTKPAGTASRTLLSLFSVSQPMVHIIRKNQSQEQAPLWYSLIQGITGTHILITSKRTAGEGRHAADNVACLICWSPASASGGNLALHVTYRPVQGG